MLWIIQEETRMKRKKIKKSNWKTKLIQGGENKLTSNYLLV